MRAALALALVPFLLGKSMRDRIMFLDNLLPEHEPSIMGFLIIRGHRYQRLRSRSDALNVIPLKSET